MYRYFSFFGSFIAFFLLTSFVTTPSAEAWIKDNDPCDPNSEMTARQQLPNFPNNAIPQTLQNNSCQYPQSVCTQNDPLNVNAGYHCKADPAANRAPGGGQKQKLRCTCLSPNTASPGNGYTCKNEAGQVVNTRDNKPEDYCRIKEMCQPGSENDVRATPLSDDTKFDTNNFIITGVICRETKGTAACTCSPDKKSIDCKPNPPAPGAPAPPAPQGPTNAACNDNFECSPYSQKDREVDRGQLKDGRTFMQEYTLQGVECKRRTITCSCEAPNSPGNGAMKCLVDGGPVPGNPRPSCQSDYACVPEPDGANLLDGNTLQQPGDIISKSMIMGVKCVNNADPKLRPPTPTVPPVPPPPCAPGKMGADGVCGAFLTDFGVIDTNIQGFVLRLFAILLSISGGIALLLIIRAGYILMTSAGNPERVKNGREQLIAAIVGLLFIIFSFVILGVIGDDLLKVPGFVAG